MPLCGLIKLYQITLAPLLGPCCRFTPSCSHYAMEALLVHGLWRGTLLAAWRILRCNPWGGHGFDPVPPRGHWRNANQDKSNNGT